MFGRKPPTLGGWLLIALVFLSGFGIKLLSSTSLLWHGVTTHGVITSVGTESCGKSSTGPVYSVQFTDQTGLTQSSTISQCTYSDFTASPGDSVSIVYLPDDPTQIAPPNGLLAHVQLDVFMSIFLGLITLILLPLWIRKRIRNDSLQRQEERAAEQ
jgi:Protein of unknown function (DUF3592)